MRVFSQEPEPTPFDLNWRMFGVHIRVHPFFWLIAALLGWGNFSRGGMPAILLWIACVFVSILIHEFGHVVVGRLFGADGRILLYSFGGLAIGSSNLRRRWQRVLVYLAGPFIQLLLAAGVFVLLLILARRGNRFDRVPGEEALLMLYRINLGWAVFNLLPIFPLDGGQVTREACEAVLPGRGTMIALGASAVICAVIAVLILMSTTGQIYVPYIGNSMYNAILFAMFAANSFQMLQVERARRNWDDRFPWER
jgi:stage IV sporulation protein FB